MSSVLGAHQVVPLGVDSFTLKSVTKGKCNRHPLELSGVIVHCIRPYHSNESQSRCKGVLVLPNGTHVMLSWLPSQRV